MKRFTVLVAAIGSLALAACGPGQAVVTAQIQVNNPEGQGTVTQALSDLEVQLLPYDRDEIFDSLEAAYPEPQPPIPDSLLAARDSVAAAERTWRESEARWNTLRDTLQSISDEMKKYNRGEARYVQLFRQFNDLDDELQRVKDTMDQSFARFDSLQKGIIARSEEVKAERDQWADKAFADAFDVMEAKADEVGKEPVVDTTDANGTVTFQADPGQWWVYARYELPYTELYWNVPITIDRGDPTQLQLTRDNAEERQSL